MHGEDVGAFLEFRLGFYTEDHFGISSFDVPITGGRAFVLQPEKLYLFVGANAAFLRGHWPVIPIAGLVWKPSKEWKVMAVLPEPKVIYSPSDRLQLWAGGQLVASSFRTDRNDAIFPRRLNGAEVDYREYRAGVGLTYSPTNAISLDLSGGYAIQRKFDFYRADVDYTANAAPYVRAQIQAKF